WMQHPSASDAASMKQWCDALALNWRMRKCRVGPFCAGNKASQQLQTWVGSTHEVNTDEDLDDDVNAELWAEFIDQRNKGGKISSPKDISASSLYRHSDVVTNRAVHNAIPCQVRRYRSASAETSLSLPSLDDPEAPYIGSPLQPLECSGDSKISSHGHAISLSQVSCLDLHTVLLFDINGSFTMLKNQLRSNKSSKSLFSCSKESAECNRTENGNDYAIRGCPRYVGYRKCPEFSLIVQTSVRIA
ncbi:hypothetical protein THAOC_32189, partial [Thalassiosira oceanica]